MTERIYTWDQQGRLEPLEGEPFAKEVELQALIAEHLELLDGRQMRPEDPLRWILIAREQGIAESSDAAARWAVDHLLADQDAVPTLVEVKRGSSPEIRRTIVGQMLEYAAHAARTWTADTLRRAFEESTDARGLDPGEELGNLLKPDGAYSGGSGTRNPAEVERRFRRKWNIDSGGSGTSIPGSGTRIPGSGTSIPEEVEQRFRGS